MAVRLSKIQQTIFQRFVRTEAIGGPFTIPAHARINAAEFSREARELLGRFDRKELATFRFEFAHPLSV